MTDVLPFFNVFLKDFLSEPERTSVKCERHPLYSMRVSRHSLLKS